MTEAQGRSWDAGSYHQVSGPMVEMARRVLERLPLAGDEHVLDAGCGTGRVTWLLLERLPRGRVLAVDADPAMVEAARQVLAPAAARASVEQADLQQLRPDLAGTFDAVLSTATFHWVLDHDRLFAELFRVLRPGGRLVAQCGGHGNITRVLAAANAASALAPLAPFFDEWSRPMRYETAEDTASRLERAGFADVRCWLEPSPVVPDDPREYLATIALGAHLQQLPDPSQRELFLDEVLDRLAEPVTVDYVRLNIDARRPTGGS